VNEWFSTAKRMGAENGMQVVGLGADGNNNNFIISIAQKSMHI